MSIPRFPVLFGLAWMIGCVEVEPSPALELSFSSSPTSAGCPELLTKSASPPTLDEIDVRLYLPDGSLHFQKSVAVRDKAAKVSGIPPPPHEGDTLRLEVLGKQNGQTTWIGGASAIQISVGRSSQVSVLMTAGGRSACINPMPYPKAFAASTALSDGKLLLAGGVNQVGSCGDGCKTFIASKQAALFDPTTGVSTVLTPMSVARALASATLLDDGTVLVMGGASRVLQKPGTVLPFTVETADLAPSYEIYRPADNTWIDKPLSGGRVFHNAIRLKDGKVLITGGGQDLGTAMNSALLYDITQSGDRLLPLAARLNSPRMGHAAVLLGDGRVLLIGGAPANGAAVEEYVPADQGGGFGIKSIAGASLNLFFHAVAVLPGKPDKLFVAGGALLPAAQVLAEPAKDNTRIISKLTESAPESKKAGPLTEARFMATLAHLGKERLFVGGGFSDLGKTPSAALEQWDLLAETFSVPIDPDGNAVRCSDPRAGSVASAFVGDRFLFLGGLDADKIRASGEVYTPKIEEGTP